MASMFITKTGSSWYLAAYSGAFPLFSLALFIHWHIFLGYSLFGKCFKRTAAEGEAL
jgi:hypothetical protein